MTSQRDRDSEQFVDQMMYLLTAPYITMPGYEDIWGDRGNKHDALLHRLALHREIFDNKECTEFEAMIYISTASLIHPLDRDWADIYFYLFHRWSPEKAKAAGIEPLLELQYPQQDHLRRLRSWIYRTQVNHLRQKSGRGSRSSRRRLQKEEKALQEEQQKLF